MKFTISNFHHKKDGFLGEDTITFYFDLQFTEPEPLLVPNYFLHLHMVKDYLEKAHPEFYSYLESVRKNLDHWGPCEGRTLDALEDEALKQLYAYAEEYLYQCNWMEKEYARHLEQSKQPPQVQQQHQEKVIKLLNKLDEGQPAIINETKRYYDFCETVERKIRDTAMKSYPEIANFDGEALKEFKYLFVRDIQSMHERLEKFLRKHKGKD